MSNDKNNQSESSIQQEQVQEVQAVTKESQITSDLISEYLQFFGLQQISRDKSFLKQLKLGSLKLAVERFDDELVFNMLDYWKSKNTLRLYVQYGYFQLPVIINVSEQRSHLHSDVLKYIESKESKVYFIRNRGKRYICKCIPIKKKKEQLNFLLISLKEYVLTKIAYELGVGAPLSNDLGFDIFVYEDCIEFFLEECQSLAQHINAFDDQQAKKLMNKLQLLHSLNIVHVDIKPDNIMYNKRKNQFVFIDFGYSRVIKQEIGYKTLTRFAGTACYCSPQMSATFGKKILYVDLYYNDVHSLTKTLKQLENEKKHINSAMFIHRQLRSEEQIRYQEDQEELQQILTKINLLRMAYLIHIGNERPIFQSFNQSLMLKNIGATVRILSQFHYCELVDKIYNFLKKTSQYPLNQLNESFQIEMKKAQYISSLKVEAAKEQQIFFKKFKIQITEGQAIVNTIAEIKSRFLLNKQISGQLLKKDQIKKLPKGDYFVNFANILLSFDVSHTLKHKLAITKIFIQSERLNLQSFETRSKYQTMEISLKYILNYFIQTLGQKFEHGIPITLSKLILMEVYSPQQLLSLGERLISLECDSVRKAILLFRLSLSFGMLDMVIFLRPQFYNVQDQMISKIKAQLKSIHDKQALKHVKVFMFLLSRQRNISLENYEQARETMQDLQLSFPQFKAFLKRLFLFKKTQTFRIYDIDKVQFGIRQLQVECKDTNTSENTKLQNTKLYYTLNIFEQCNLFHTPCHVFGKAMSREQLLEEQSVELYQSQFNQIHHLFLSDPSKIYKYQTIFRLQDIQICLQVCAAPNQLIDFKHKLKLIFNYQYIQNFSCQVASLISSHQVSKHFLSVKMLTQIYLSLYETKDQEVQSLRTSHQQLANILATIQCQDCKMKCSVIFYNLKIAFSKFNLSKIQTINCLISRIELYTRQQSENIFDSSIIYAVNEAIELLQQSSDNQQSVLNCSELKANLYNTLKRQKLYLFGLNLNNSSAMISFLFQQLRNMSGFLEQLLEINNQIASFIEQFPCKRYQRNYEWHFKLVISYDLRWWKEQTPTIIDSIFSTKTYKQLSPLYSLFFAFIIPLYQPSSKYFKKLAFFICRSAYLTISTAKFIILAHFFTCYLFVANAIMNKKEKRHKIKKFISYVYLFKMPFGLFLRHLNLTCLKRMAQNSIHYRKLRGHVKKFYMNGFRYQNHQ